MEQGAVDCGMTAAELETPRHSSDDVYDLMKQPVTHSAPQLRWSGKSRCLRKGAVFPGCGQVVVANLVVVGQRQTELWRMLLHFTAACVRHPHSMQCTYCLGLYAIPKDQILQRIKQRFS
jgi:hypothetical protein